MTAVERTEFRSLYEENVATVFGFLRSRVGAQAAEDLAAETFCRAYAAIDEWEDRGLPVRAWLLRIAYHLIVAQSRKPKVDIVSAYDAREVQGSDDTESGVDDQFEGAAAFEALKSLPEAHRTVIELRHLRGLSVPETAEVLGLTPDAVRALTYRALRALRAAHLSRWEGAGAPVIDV